MRHRVLTAFFPRRHQAAGAFKLLLADGVASEAICLLPKVVDQRDDLGVIVTSRATLGAALGAFVGGLSGALAGALAAAGSVIVPHLDLVLAGPTVAALVGAGAAGAVGLVAGALLGAARPAYEAAYQKDAAQLGGALLAVRCPEARANVLEQLLSSSGGLRIRHDTFT